MNALGFDQAIVRPTARMWSLPVALEHMRSFVSDRAGGLGKSAALDLDCPAILVRADVVDVLIPTVVQLLRNAVTHGIEAPTDRLLAGKPLGGSVSLRAEVRSGALVVTVGDDGRGFDHKAAGSANRRGGKVSGLMRVAERLAAIGGRVDRVPVSSGSMFAVSIPVRPGVIVAPASDVPASRQAAQGAPIAAPYNG